MFVVGQLCEGDGECGTSDGLNNCYHYGELAADVYVVVEAGAENVTTYEPTSARPSGNNLREDDASSPTLQKSSKTSSWSVRVSSARRRDLVSAE